jgi:hypothetical protein
MRAAMHRAGSKALAQLLQFEAPDAGHRTIPCSCGHSARFKELRRKIILSVVGPVQIRRPYYFCARCCQGQCPVDAELGVAGLEVSPGVRRMQAVVGSNMPFGRGCEPLKVLAGLDVTGKAIERTAEAIGAGIAKAEQQEVDRAKQLVFPMVSKQTISKIYVLMDGTGVPVVPAETQGRAGKIEGQRAHTRECKLGCVFTQTGVDEDGRPVRDPNSTTYTGAIETAEEFGLRIYTEAWRRGWEWAGTRVVIGDGAVWIWNLAGLHFPGAIQIVDLYHARQHLWAVAALLFPNDSVRQKRWIGPTQRLLDEGRITNLVKRLRKIESENQEVVQKLSSEAEYFERNAPRMRYPEFRKLGLFVGSGVVEAGCKTVIASRLKASGMFWTVQGANAIIALRCSLLNGRFENYWESARPA